MVSHTVKWPFSDPPNVTVFTSKKIMDHGVMPKSEIPEFAKTLVRKVRDAAIQSCDRNLSSDPIHVILENGVRRIPRNASPTIFQAWNE